MIQQGWLLIQLYLQEKNSYMLKNAITRKLILPTMFGKVVATPLIL